MNPAAAYMLLKSLGNPSDVAPDFDLSDLAWTRPRLTFRRTLKWLAFSAPSLIVGTVVGYLVWRHTAGTGYEPHRAIIARVWVMFLCCFLAMGAAAMFITPPLFYGVVAIKNSLRRR